MAKRRILSGGIAQESHSFNPILTTRARFDVQGGEAAVRRNRGANSTLGGIITAADAIGAEVIVPAIYRAQSGGPVDDAVFEEVSDIMLAAARRGDFDAVVLPLHGGMLTTTLADPEGELALRLRQIVGPAVPITAAFDLHAHVTPQTLAPLDFLSGYLTNPHADQADTARRAFTAAMDILDGRLDPVCVSVFFNLLTLGNDRTDEEPLKGLHARAKAAVDGGAVYDASIFNAQQYLDVEGLGQVVIVYGNGETKAAETLADQLAQDLWDARGALVGRYTPLDDCLDRLGTENGPILVLGDQGDRVAGGGPGDSTFILNAVLDRKLDVPAVIPIFAPEAVEACERAGIGATLELTVGGRFTTVSPPTRAVGLVVSLGHATPVIYDGPADRGTRVEIERHAVFRIGQINVLLTNQPYAYIDPNYFRAVGLPPERMRLVVTRSGYHYTLNYASIGECIVVDTPGITSYDVAELPWRRARPFAPIDSMSYEPRRNLRRRAI